MRFSPATRPLLRSMLALSLGLGASACFVDSRPDGDDSEGGTTGGNTTSAGPASGISASATASQSSTAPTSPTAGPTDPATDPTTDSATDSATDPTAPDPTSDTASGSEGTTGGADDTSSEGGGSDASTGEFALSVDDLEVGELVITEVMNNPNCTADNCEWIEIYNATGTPVDLLGLRVGDLDDAQSNSPDGLITTSAIVQPGGLAVLVRQGEVWPYDVPFTAEYGGNVAFTNGSVEAAAIFNSDNEILDQTANFFGEAADSGRSFILQSKFWGAVDNDDSDNWCLSDTVLESEAFSDDWGTPGAPDVLCATPAK